MPVLSVLCKAQEYLIISIAKKKARVWSAGPWNKAALNPRRFKDVAWTKVQTGTASKTHHMGGCQCVRGTVSQKLLDF